MGGTWCQGVEVRELLITKKKGGGDVSIKEKKRKREKEKESQEKQKEKITKKKLKRNDSIEGRSSSEQINCSP